MLISKTHIHPYFAEDNGGAAGGAGDPGAGAKDLEGANGNEHTQGGEGKGKDLSFDDFLGQGKNQAEFDRRMSKGIETALSKERDRLKAIYDDRVDEIERLANMTEAEKATYMADKKAKDMAERERAITKRELAADAKNTLADKELPIELSELINYSDKDSCDASIASIEKVFKSAVEKAVNERLKGGGAPKDARTEGDPSKSPEDVIKAQITDIFGLTK